MTHKTLGMPGDPGKIPHAITVAKLTDMAIDSGRIAVSAVDVLRLPASAITGAKLCVETFTEGAP